MKALFRRWMVVVTTGLIPLLGITTGCNGLERTSVVGNSSEVATGTTNATSSAKPGLEAATSPNPTNTLPATPRVPEPKQMSPGLEGVVKLAKAGIPEDVMLAYVAQTTNTFQLGPDELIYLTDIGVPPSVLIWMQQRAPGTSPVVPNAVAAAGSNSVPTNALAPAAAAGTSAPVAAAPAGVATPPPPAAPEPTTNVITPTYVAQPALPPVDPNAPPPPAGTTVVPTPVVVQQPVTVNYFYDALSPHGTWIEVPGYGRCWRPNYAVLGAGWQPYADGGHWVWTDFGWYWVSDYSWGWAPFHYGRWCHVPRHGWLWSPDTVWGPAWVCWRRTSSHCGWAPLPPGAYFSGSSWYFGGGRVGFDYGFNLGFSFFTFVPWTRFCEPRPHHFYASRNHAASLYRESTVVNNTVIGNHNNVVYQGVGRDVVQQASRTPIPQAAIRETAWTTANAGVRERMDQSQGSPIIQSPRITAAPPSKPGSTASSGKWAPSSGSGSSSTTTESGPTLAERNALGFREEAFRSTRTAFDPGVGSSPVFLPATRSGFSPATPATPASPVTATPNNAIASRAPVPAPTAATPPARPTGIAAPTYTAPNPSPSPSTSPLTVGAGGKRLTPPNGGMALNPAVGPALPASVTPLAGSRTAGGVATPIPNNRLAPTTAAVTPASPFAPSTISPSLPTRVAGSGEIAPVAPARQFPVQSPSAFSQPIPAARPFTPQPVWTTPSPRIAPSISPMPERPASVAPSPAPFSRAMGGVVTPSAPTRTGPVTGAAAPPARSGGGAGGRRDR